jgi:ribosomal protein L7/L12
MAVIIFTVLAGGWAGYLTEAIRRYRQRHPGVGLREAKQVVDDCAPGGQRL